MKSSSSEEMDKRPAANNPGASAVVARWGAKKPPGKGQLPELEVVAPPRKQKSVLEGQAGSVRFPGSRKAPSKFARVESRVNVGGDLIPLLTKSWGLTPPSALISVPSVRNVTESDVFSEDGKAARVRPWQCSAYIIKIGSAITAAPAPCGPVWHSVSPLHVFSLVPELRPCRSGAQDQRVGHHRRPLRRHRRHRRSRHARH
jgi:hypothetical protein